MKYFVSLLNIDRESVIAVRFMQGYSTKVCFCVGHPWIVDDNIAPDKLLDSAVLSRLKQFSAMNKLKKMALRVRILLPFLLWLVVFFVLVC